MAEISRATSATDWRRIFVRRFGAAAKDGTGTEFDHQDRARFESSPPENPARNSLTVGAIVADGFDRTTVHGFDAESFLFLICRLGLDVGITPIVGTSEIIRRGFPAQVAVDALIVHVKFSVGVFRILVFEFSHTRELPSPIF